MNIFDQILEAYPESLFLKADGFNDAVIGVEDNEMKLICSVKKCLDISEKDMPYEEAVEFFEYNVSGAYMGERTLIWCWDNFYE